MAAVNKDPFCHSRNKDGKAHKFHGLVQAGSSQAIKCGELCCFDKTASNWVPVSAAGDFIYPLAISAEEQTAADLARFIEFYSLHPDDVFEFVLAAARALALGDAFTVTASDSQKLTYTATGFPICRSVDDGHYPETGTTIRNQSYVRVSFSKHASAWGRLIAGDGVPVAGMVLETDAAVTLRSHMSGLKLVNLGASGAVAHVLPQTRPAGTFFDAYAAVAQDHGFDPGAAGGIYIEGAKQADDKQVTVDAIGDSLRVTSDANGDWIGEATITSAADQTAGIDIES